MPESEGLTGEMPVRRGYTPMHLAGSRRRGLISASDGTDTSKCPYMGDCHYACRRAIRPGIGAYNGSERCKMHGAPFSEVVG